jgi:hypothetical protein
MALNLNSPVSNSMSSSRVVGDPLCQRSAFGLKPDCTTCSPAFDAWLWPDAAKGPLALV